MPSTFLCLTKDNERYCILFDDEHRAEALRTLGRWATNPDLSFAWFDAAVLSQRIRQAAQEESLNVRIAQ